METKETPSCPHCGNVMQKMEMPSDAGYDSPFMWVCFNDECAYFVNGWAWMLEKYQVKSSYRHRINPLTGAAGPLPVWSKDAMKDRIVN